jgi:hypothetical protein
MKGLMFVLMVLTTIAVSAQQSGFNYNIKVKSTKGIVKKLNADMTVIELAGNANKRYVASNLPEDFNKDGLHVTFCGLESLIPPYMRMIGTPIQLKIIQVTGKEKKLFKLTKKKFKL